MKFLRNSWAVGCMSRTHLYLLITARIRRMGEGTVFSLSVHTSKMGGGYSVLPMGWRYPIPGQDWGYPNSGPRWGVPPSQVRRRGTPSQVQDRGGTPISGQDGGVHWSQVRTGGGLPQLEQHSMYLLHGMQYASCVHAGGLSCFVPKLTLSFTRKVANILQYLLLHKTSTCFNWNIFTSPNLYYPHHSHNYQTHLITI